MYTTSTAFLKSLADAGITHAFVNWGSDHPGLLEDLERQRIEGGGRTKPMIVTCPNEMVALSAAQGYAQVTGKPAAVIIHVDVGTQALAGAIHNVDRGRTPVLIYAGASPFSSTKELKGGRNEWIMWLQEDIPDQTAIVRQYMRYTAQISSGSTVSEYVNRALQIATSDPKGPVYLWARREVMEQEIPKTLTPTNIQLWPALEPSGLSPRAATHIATALFTTSSVGLWHVDAELVCRADAELALEQILHCVRTSDGRECRMLGDPSLQKDMLIRGKELQALHEEMVFKLDNDEADFPDPRLIITKAARKLSVANILGFLRGACKGLSTLILNESISNYREVWMHMRPEAPGSVLTSGGSSLGWALGAAVGAYLGEEVMGRGVGKGHDLIITIVGDGSYMFGVPSSAYWMARKYNTPFLTIILNNGGWKSPKLSMLGVHPHGHGSKAEGERLSVGFGPQCPDYSQIAVAASAGWAWGKRIGTDIADSNKDTVEKILIEAVGKVVKERRCAVVDCVIETI
ncbi:hypothetical protein C0991_006806 [Blastosporella zonata]|nr:hypothetical protein C0991_006806 [Blastosporella zonata]